MRTGACLLFTFTLAIPWIQVSSCRALAFGTFARAGAFIKYFWMNAFFFIAFTLASPRIKPLIYWTCLYGADTFTCGTVENFSILAFYLWTHTFAFPMVKF